MRIRSIKPDEPKTWADIYHCAPGHEFVYRLRDSKDNLLYVGVTWSAKARWAKHRKRSWWSQVATAQIDCYPNDREALFAELAAIHTENPQHNRRGRKT